MLLDFFSGFFREQRGGDGVYEKLYLPTTVLKSHLGYRSPSAGYGEEPFSEFAKGLFSFSIFHFHLYLAGFCSSFKIQHRCHLLCGAFLDSGRRS